MKQRLIISSAVTKRDDRAIVSRVSIILATLVAAMGVATFSAAQSATDTPQAGSAEPLEYVLQSGDQITIRVFSHAELEETVQIRPDGKISLVLVDEVPAAGLTGRELDERLTASYSQFYRDVQLTVIVRTFSNHKVYVGGEVGQPGLVPLTGRLTALTAVLQAGGFRTTACTDSVILLRDEGAGTPRVSRLDLKDVLGGETADVALEPFDVIYVPMSGIAKVDKFVDQYIRQLIPISLQAGFTYILGGSAVVIPAQ